MKFVVSMVQTPNAWKELNPNNRASFCNNSILTVAASCHFPKLPNSTWKDASPSSVHSLPSLHCILESGRSHFDLWWQLFHSFGPTSSPLLSSSSWPSNSNVTYVHVAKQNLHSFLNLLAHWNRHRSAVPPTTILPPFFFFLGHRRRHGESHLGMQWRRKGLLVCVCIYMLILRPQLGQQKELKASEAQLLHIGA